MKTEYETIFYYAKNALREKNALKPNFRPPLFYFMSYKIIFLNCERSVEKKEKKSENVPLNLSF